MSVNYDKIAAAVEFLALNFKKQPELNEVAKAVHLSEFHFQRMFSEWVGISPKRFLQYLTAGFLKAKLNETNNLIEAAEVAGLSTQSRVYDLFVTLEAVTPHEYKSQGNNLLIYYGFHDTPFGECFLAATERGICGLEFVERDTREQVIQQFTTTWKKATIQLKPKYTQTLVEQIFNSNSKGRHLHLLVKGSNFQVKVWDALLKIPVGGVTTYERIADYIGHPRAVRAVGTAIGHNPIAYLIPCHRVIRKVGALGEYHWGRTRKQTIVGWEMAKYDNQQPRNQPLQ